MVSSQVLEVAVGLVFIYLVVSTVCSGIKEIIARLFDTRAKTLEGTIRKMLADPDNKITSAILQNHLITGAIESGNRPSYISSRNFALALFDTIAPADPTKQRTVQDLKDGISKLPDKRVQKSLLGVVDSAQQDADLARQRVENWFDDSMERASGAYKRTAQKYIAVFGLVLCAALNIDTLLIVRELWSDDAVRATITKQAQDAAANGHAPNFCPDGSNSISDCIRAANIPPLGWAHTGSHAPPELSEWPLKIFGILISGIAVALGAPFWFDLLNKIVNLRLTGNPPPDSRQSTTS